MATGWLLALIPASVPFAAVNAAKPALEPTACAAPEYRQLDFWRGDWDIFEIDQPKTPVARVKVARILDGCVLLEEYSDFRGHKGRSFSIFDVSRKVWHQTWVTNGGVLLVIEGSLQPSGEMVLSGVDHDGGKERQVRGRWIPVDGGVREVATRSIDGGATWTTWFDLMFRRHGCNARTSIEPDATPSATEACIRVG